MKLPKLIGATLAIAATQLVAAHAADLYLVNLRATCKSMDGDRVVITRMSNQTILRAFLAEDIGSSNNIRNLRLVYDPESDRILIADYTSGEILDDWFGFGNSTTSSNSDDTRRERHAFVFLSSNGEAVGSALISERVIHSNGPAGDRLAVRGTMLWVEPGDETIPPQICTGSFTTGKKLVVKTTVPPPEPTP
jgi:hypothetical protein